jgi:hypothetical protein
MRGRLALIGILAVATSAVPAAAAGSGGFPRGHAHIVDVRTFARFEHPYSSTGMSADGARVSFVVTPSYDAPHGTPDRFGVMDLVHDTERFLGTSNPYAGSPIISPDGNEVAYVGGRQLRVIDIASGSISTVFRGTTLWAPLGWLSDDRIAFVDHRRRLLYVRPGERAVDTGFRFPVPTKWYLHPSIAVSPDGGRALYGDGCGVWLVDLTSHRRTLLGKSMGVPRRAWSPDGTHFLIQSMPDGGGRCQFDEGPGLNDVLFRGSGRVIGKVLGNGYSLTTGHGISWSTDGMWLLISDLPTGTEVGGLEQLFAVNLQTRRVSRIIDRRLIDYAFMGPGDWILWSRYSHNTTAVANGHDEGAVKLGRLVPG